MLPCVLEDKSPLALGKQGIASCWIDEATGASVRLWVTFEEVHADLNSKGRAQDHLNWSHFWKPQTKESRAKSQGCASFLWGFISPQGKCNVWNIWKPKWSCHSTWEDTCEPRQWCNKVRKVGFPSLQCLVMMKQSVLLPQLIIFMTALHGRQSVRLQLATPTELSHATGLLDMHQRLACVWDTLCHQLLWQLPEWWKPSTLRTEHILIHLSQDKCVACVLRTKSWCVSWDEENLRLKIMIDNNNLLISRGKKRVKMED